MWLLAGNLSRQRCTCCGCCGQATHRAPAACSLLLPLHSIGSSLNFQWCFLFQAHLEEGHKVPLEKRLEDSLMKLQEAPFQIRSELPGGLLLPPLRNVPILRMADSAKGNEDLPKATEKPSEIYMMRILESGTFQKAQTAVQCWEGQLRCHFCNDGGVPPLPGIHTRPSSLPATASGVLGHRNLSQGRGPHVSTCTPPATRPLHPSTAWHSIILQTSGLLRGHSKSFAADLPHLPLSRYLKEGKPGPRVFCAPLRPVCVLL